MSEHERELESTGSFVGGLITWMLIAIILGVAAMSGATWGLWGLGVWGTLLAVDFLQARVRQTKMYVRLLSELWQLPF